MRRKEHVILNGIEMKSCGHCHTILPLSAFCKDGRTPDKLNYQCKTCGNSRGRINYEKTKAKVVSRHRKYYQENKERWKNYRPKDPKATLAKYMAKHRDRQRSRWRFQQAFYRGKIKRKPCSVCQNADSEAHHPDYSKPFDVVWLCKKHHGEAHRTI